MVIDTSLARGIAKQTNREAIERDQAFPKRLVLTKDGRGVAYRAAIAQLQKRFGEWLLFQREIGKGKDRMTVLGVVRPVEGGGLQHSTGVVAFRRPDRAGGLPAGSATAHCQERLLQACGGDTVTAAAVFGMHATTRASCSDEEFDAVLRGKTVGATVTATEIVLWRGTTAVTCIPCDRLDQYQGLYDALMAGKTVRGAVVCDTREMRPNLVPRIRRHLDRVRPTLFNPIGAIR